VSTGKGKGAGKTQEGMPIEKLDFGRGRDMKITKESFERKKMLKRARSATNTHLQQKGRGCLPRSWGVGGDGAADAWQGKGRLGPSTGTSGAPTKKGGRWNLAIERKKKKSKNRGK